MRHKFTPPRLPPHYLRRHRAFEALEQAQVFKSVLLQGGPASGKSSLLWDWLQAQGCDFFWYNLDRSDAQSLDFIERLFMGLQQRWPELHFEAAELRAALSESTATQRNFLVALSDDLARQLSATTLLVLDDCHHLVEQPELLSVLGDFARFLPDSFQLILTARPRTCNEWLLQEAQGDLLMLDPELLALSPEESLALSVNMGLEVNADVQTLLQEKAPAWMGGQVLLLQMLKRFPDAPEDWLRAKEADQLLFAFYLRLLSERDRDFEDFLLQASYLPALDLDLCRRAFPQLSPQALQDHLARIQNLGLFVTPLKQGLSLSPALKDYLQEEYLRRTPRPQQGAFFKDWAERLSESDFELAFDFFLRAEAGEKALSLLLEREAELLAAQRYQQLGDMLSALKKLGLEHVQLELVQAKVLRLQGQLDAASQILSRLESDSASLPQLVILQGAIALQQGQLKEAERKMQQARTEDIPLDMQAFRHNILGVLNLMQHRPQQALRSFHLAYQDYAALGQVGNQIKIMHNEGLAYTWLGQLKEARRAYQLALELAQKSDQSLLTPPMTEHNLAIVCIYLQEFDSARVLLEQAQTRAQKLGLITEQVYTLATLARLYTRMNQAEQAYHYLEKSLQWVRQYRRAPLQQFVDLIALEHYFTFENYSAAEAILKQYEDARASLELEQLEWQIYLAEYDFLQADYVRAESALESLQTRLQEVDYRYHLMRVQLLRGRVAQAAKTDAAVHFDAARALCAREGYPLPTSLRPNEKTENKSGQALVPDEGSALHSHHLRIQLFGKLMVWNGESLISTSAWGGKKTRLLLALLLLEEQGLDWQQIAERLSPEEDMKRATVNTLMTRLRRALEDPRAEKQQSPSGQRVLFTDGRYRLNPSLNLKVDLHHFNYCYHQAQTAPQAQQKAFLMDALETYKPELLREFSSYYWVQLEQESHRLRFRQMGRALFAYLQRAGLHEELLQAAQSAIQKDRLFEEAHLAKLETLEQQGHRRAIVQHFKQMQKIYRKELGLPAPEEAQEIYDRIRA